MEDGVVTRFASLVAEVALEEELRLRRAAGEGIFFMPELAFAFAVGRATAEHSVDVFGEDGWTWKREIQVGPVGPVDLVFARENDSPRMLVEFKMRDTVQKYMGDINKLSAIRNEEDLSLFCVLMDVWADKPLEDPRFVSLKERLGSPAEPLAIFTTKQDLYKSRIACVVGVWGIE